MGDRLIAGEALYKGALLIKVDKLLNERNWFGRFTRRRLFLAALKSINLNDDNHEDAYINVLKNERFAVGGRPLIGLNDQAEQFLRKWFASDFGVASVSRTLIEGTIYTIEEANEVNLPIDSYWLKGFGSEFQVKLYRSDYQVTRVIVTPDEIGT